MTDQITKRLIDNAIQDQIFLERAKLGHVKAVVPLLNTLSKDITSAIVDMDNNSQREVNRTIKIIKKLISKTYKKILEICEKEYLDLLTGEFESSVDRSMPEQGEMPPSYEEDSSSIIESSLVLGATFSAWMLSLETQLSNQVERVVRQGVQDSVPTSLIARTVRGTSSRGFKDGLFNRQVNNLASVLKTSIQTFATEAKIQTWKFNGIDRYIWISVLDGRTSHICRGRSNKIYEIGSGPKPPAHFNCRSSIAPYRDGMKVPKDYSTWLREQPVSFVEDVLGKSKAKLFLNNEVSLDRFTTPTGRELTIQELRNKRFSES